MDIQILELIEGARKAQGLTVVIDVFRAFSLECYLFDAGVVRIYPIGSLEDAFAMKKAHPDYILCGERKGAKVEGCDFGNSPCQMEGADLRGKTVIHTTSAGTQGIVNAAAAGAEEIVTASLVNANAVAAYIRKKNPEKVSIVAMGKAGLARADEDVLCAEYIKSVLEGRPFDVQARADAMKTTAGAHFFNPDTQEVYPEKDFYLSTRCNAFDFVIRVGKDSGGRLITERV
ncbi:MAG: 2-phosphosulfolactate phosphatase [Lachnospiraceae bacterium]|nr:2-phosphosulfolactate phosphatase [Lachnospiraceae bacterium]